LDLALVGPHLRVGAPGGVDLDALAGTSLRDDRGGELQEVVGHAVPPRVTPVMRSVAWPQPTGTLCPSLPQVPGVMSKSVATASMRRSTSGPLPIRLASRNGSVMRPPSIRYAS